MSGREPAAAGPPPSDADATGPALDRAVAELDEAAARLRRDDLDPEEAAVLVERCADVATELGAALAREARAARAEAAPGQETLL